MRTFSNDIQNQFNRFNFLAVDCVYIGLQFGGDPLQLCTGGIDITFDNGEVYTAQGEFLGFSSISEDFDVKVGKFTIKLSGVTQGYVDKFLDNDFEGSEVIVYKVFLNTETLAIVDEPIMVFNGSIYNATITENASTCEIGIECSTLWADFERTNGRLTNNGSNWLYQGNELDKCFSKTGVVANTEYKWGRT